MAIRTRIAMSVAIITFVLATAGSGAYYAYLGRATRSTLRHALLRRAARVQLAITTGTIKLTAPAPAPPVPDQAVVQVEAPGRVLYTTALAGTSPILTSGQQHRALAHPSWVVRSSRVWGSPHLLLAEAVRGAHGDVLTVGTSMDPVRDSMRAAREGLAVGGVLAVLFAAGGAWLLAGYALRPVERLRSESEALAGGRSEAYLGVPPTGDELAALAATLNSMLARSREANLRQRRFVAAASHELRTPLAAMRAELELASGDAGAARLCDRLAARVQHLSEVCNGLLAVAEGHRASIAVGLVRQPLEPMVAASLEAAIPAARHAGVDLVLDAEAGVVAAVDDVRFRQVIDNLVANAIAHSPSASAVVVSVRRDRGRAVVEVRDRGPGFGEEMLAGAFEAFVRGRRQEGRAGGCGLGLTIVELVVSAHGGRIELSDPPGGGAMAVVELPALAPPRGSDPLHDRVRGHSGPVPGAGPGRVRGVAPAGKEGLRTCG